MMTQAMSTGTRIQMIRGTMNALLLFSLLGSVHSMNESAADTSTGKGDQASFPTKDTIFQGDELQKEFSGTEKTWEIKKSKYNYSSFMGGGSDSRTAFVGTYKGVPDATRLFYGKPKSSGRYEYKNAADLSKYYFCIPTSAGFTKEVLRNEEGRASKIQSDFAKAGNKGYTPVLVIEYTNNSTREHSITLSQNTKPEVSVLRHLQDTKSKRKGKGIANKHVVGVWKFEIKSASRNTTDKEKNYNDSEFLAFIGAVKNAGAEIDEALYAVTRIPKTPSSKKDEQNQIPFGGNPLVSSGDERNAVQSDEKEPEKLTPPPCIPDFQPIPLLGDPEDQKATAGNVNMEDEQKDEQEKSKSGTGSDEIQQQSLSEGSIENAPQSDVTSTPESDGEETSKPVNPVRVVDRRRRRLLTDLLKL